MINQQFHRFEVGMKVAVFKSSEGSNSWTDYGNGIVMDIAYNRASEPSHLKILALDKGMTKEEFDGRSIGAAELVPILSDKFYCAPF